MSTTAPSPTAPLTQFISPRLWQWREFNLNLGATPVLVSDVVEVHVASGDADAVVTVRNAKRGSFVTGAGDDRIVLDALSNNRGVGNLFTVSAGAGNDDVVLNGSLGFTEATVSLGEGNDALSISGMRTARIDAGAGDDLLRVGLDATYTIDGGDGTDTVQLAVNRDAVSLRRTGDAAAQIGLAGQPKPLMTLAGVERVVFADGSVEWLVEPPAAPAPTPEEIDPRFAYRVAALPGTVADPGVAREGARPTVWLSGKVPGAEVLRGTAANETLSPNGYDTLVGGLGDDRYYFGGRGAVIELPGEGVDTVLYTGSDTLLLPDNVENAVLTGTGNGKLYGAHLVFMGGAGGTSVVGNALSNILTGDPADNTLDGMAGNDVLIGGAGVDTFVFGRGYGHDTVRDFVAGTDRLRLLDGVTTFAEAMSRITDTDQGARLALGDATLTLQNVRKADLTARDFQFSVRYEDYRLTFSDDFDALNLFNGRNEDGGVWRTRTLTGNGHSSALSEKQYYVEPGWRGTESISAGSGVATIKSEYHPEWSAEMNGKTFTSGTMNTSGTFAQQYGYFEARMKLTAADGLFPAFWLMPADMTWPPEIDIMEQLGRDPHTVHQMTTAYPVDTTQWHVYGLEWTPDRLTWLVDGKVTNVVYNHNQHKPMYIILNQAIGGTWAGAPTWKDPKSGDVLGTTEIDWVRAYELKDEAGGVATSGAAAGHVTDAAGKVHRFATGHDADNAPHVTFSIGRLGADGQAAEANSFAYLADTHGKLRFSVDNLKIGITGWMSLVTENNRDDDSFSADIENAWVGMNTRIRDDDGGAFNLVDMTTVNVVLGGAADSKVAVLRGQGGLIETGAGNDTVLITDPRTWRRGDETTFVVSTGAGDDTITGWTGADRRLVAEGGAGRDRITGSGGADTLAGGAGNDILTGGGGADLFVFRAGENGHDTITDFAAGTDRLRFEGIERGALVVSRGPDGALVSWGEGSVLLQGVASAGPANWILA